MMASSRLARTTTGLLLSTMKELVNTSTVPTLSYHHQLASCVLLPPGHNCSPTCLCHVGIVRYHLPLVSPMPNLSSNLECTPHSNSSLAGTRSLYTCLGVQKLLLVFKYDPRGSC